MKRTLIKIVIPIVFIIYAISNAYFGLLLGEIIDIVIKMNIKEIAIKLLITLSVLVINYVSGLVVWRLAYGDAEANLNTLKIKLFGMDTMKVRNKNIDITAYTDKCTYLLDKYYMAKWEVVFNISLATAAIVALIHINWVMCITAICVSFTPMLVPKLLKKRLETNSKGLAKEESGFSVMVEDYLNGRYEWKKYGNETQDYISNVVNKNSLNYEKSRRVNEYGIYFAQASTGMVGNIGFVVVFAVGAVLSVKGIITAGSIVSVIQLLNYLVGPITRAAGAKNRIVAAEPIYKKLIKQDDCDEVQLNINHEEKDPEKALSIKNMSITYDDKSIIKDLSLDVLRGKKYVIKGKSGAGKTSIAKALSEKMEGVTGSLSFYDNERDTIIRYIEQTPYIFKETVRNNVLMYRTNLDEKAKSLIKYFDLEHLDLDKKCDNDNVLSGGEKYRISLIRALLDDPDILIVDEPTAALDKENADNVIKYLLSLDKSVIIITHDESAELYDSVDKVLEIKNKRFSS